MTYYAFIFSQDRVIESSTFETEEEANEWVSQIVNNHENKSELWWIILDEDDLSDEITISPSSSGRIVYLF